MKGIQTQCCNHPETVSETVFLVLISLYTYLAILDDSLLDLTPVILILSQAIVIVGLILFFTGIMAFRRPGNWFFVQRF